MVDCIFCGKDIPKSTGIIYVYKSGKKVDFCSRKCEKHANKFKHKAREQKWVTSRKEKD